MDTILVTLTTAGTSTGPFNLYSNVDGYVSAFATGISKAALLAGYLSTVAPTGTTIVRVISTGTCTNYIDIPVSGITTTTSTSSSTTSTSTTAIPALRVHVSFSNTNAGIVCSGTNKEFVWYNPTLVGFGPGTTFWTNGALTIPYSNTSGWTLCGLLTTDGGNGHVYNFGGGNTVGSDTGTIC